MPPNTNPKDFCWTHYFHLETINAWLEMLAKDYSFIKVVELEASYEGIPIKGIKMSKRPGNPAIFVEGGIHSREWISPATATFILNQLITSNNSDVMDLANNFDWFFFPVVNPDGYKNTFESDRLWRKNRKPYGICRGVDLNRNFDSNWSGEGSSADPCSYDFAGGSVLSEPESRAITNFIINNKVKENIKAYIALHSYSQYLMFPFGHTEEKVP
jgi:murein tripeptide amidase MpaA